MAGGSRSRFAWFVLVAILAGGIGYASSIVTAQSPRAPAALKAEDPPYRGLDANLYMQTAAEYRACCFQAYNLASLRLQEEVAAFKDKGCRLAVVLDLDETAIDNAGFQAMQLRSNIAYDQRLWDIWEERHGDLVGLVPGAKDFILTAQKMGVTPVYISNRNEKFREQTRVFLKRLGIGIESETQLKLATTTSDKTERRKEAERDYTVVLYVGDNLRDFDEKFRCRKLETRSADELDAAIRERFDRVNETHADWGRKWIILPNTAYGEWTRPLGNGKADLDRLAPVVSEKK